MASLVHLLSYLINQQGSCSILSIVGFKWFEIGNKQQYNYIYIQTFVDLLLLEKTSLFTIRMASLHFVLEDVSTVA